MKLKLFFSALLGGSLMIAGTAYAVNVSVPQSTAYGQVLIGNATGGSYSTAASSTLGIALGDTTGTLSIDRGGTGQVTANAALNAFLPTQTSNNGKFLTTDGSNSSWATVSGSSFSFTPSSAGNATSTTILFNSGLVSVGSSTFSGLTSGLVGNNGGKLYGFASTSLFGFTPASNAITIGTTYPILGGGDLSANRTLSLDFGTTTSNTWGGTQTFTNAPVLAALSGVLYGNSGAVKSIATSSLAFSAAFSGASSLGALVSGSNATVDLATNGVALTKLAQIAANNILGNNTGSTGNVVAFATSTLGIALTDTTGSLLVSRLSGVVPVTNGGTGWGAVLSGSIPYGNGTSALSTTSAGTAGNVLALLSGVPTWTATTTFTAPLSYGAGAVTLNTTSGLTTSSNNLAQIEHPSFAYATSTAWSATTTIPLGVGYGQVWNSIRCFTDAGTLNVDLYHASSHTNLVNASTTIGIFTLSTNTTVTSGDTMKVDIGTPASSPTKISCTVSDTF